MALRRLRTRRRSRCRNGNPDQHCEAQRHRPPRMARRRAGAHRRHAAVALGRPAAVELVAAAPASGSLTRLLKRSARPRSWPDAYVGTRNLCALTAPQQEIISRNVYIGLVKSFLAEVRLLRFRCQSYLANEMAGSQTKAVAEANVASHSTSPKATIESPNTETLTFAVQANLRAFIG